MTDTRNFDFKRNSEHTRFWDIIIENQEITLDAREVLDDDLIPGITLHYGFGALGMPFCDAELAFTENTCYMHPVITDWDTFNFEPLYSKDRFWSKIFIEAGNYISKKAQRRYMVNPFPSPSPLDIANLLRGNDIFTDYFEYPDELKRFLELAVPAIVDNSSKIQNAIHNPWGGVYTFGNWIPSGVFYWKMLRIYPHLPNIKSLEHLILQR